MFLRPQEVAKKLGSSTQFARTMIGKAKPKEQKREDGKTLFEYETVVKYIQLLGK